MLSGDNGILQRATDSKQNSERADAKEQARIDIMAWITDKMANHQNASLDDEKVKEILSDNKSYVKEAKDTSFITAKGEYEIPYSELYQASNVTPSNPETPGNSLATLKTTIENESVDCMIDEDGIINYDMTVWRYNITGETCSINGYEDDGDVYSAYNGRILEDGSLEHGIPVYIKVQNKTYKVTELGDYSLGAMSELKNVIIPSSIITIGGNAFCSCSKLSSVTIPNTVTTIGHGAFFNCSNLPNIIIPNTVTTIGESAFQFCSSLTNLTLPNNITSIQSETFNNCRALTSITIPNSVTSISYNAFSVCTALTSVTIPNSVTSIGDNVFSGCTALTSVTIPNSVTNLGRNTFYDWTSSQTININFKESELPSGWNSDWSSGCHAQINYLP